MNAAEYLMCEMELTGSRIFFDKRVRRDHRMLAGKNGAMVVIKNGLSIAREHWALIKAQIKQEWYQRFGHLLEDCTEIPD
ncbi:MAG: hypothetical protein KGL39_52250, partial [Patescibacteria group bacterium]|nr:hypothetical protein [Patescibacteria group bacterium]